uniref:macrophage receptor MARCO-like n=1 Tax=Styela clava TaxID=7725 RepID=UPI00193A8952|nr:macrophage receptor MARCO-like [Styela clava]
MCDIDIQENEKDDRGRVSSDLPSLTAEVEMESMKVESSIKQRDIQEVKNSVRIVDRKIVSRDIRLDDSSKGTVELFKNGIWGTICDDDWDIKDAHVICKMLGFTIATASRAKAYYGEGTGPIFMDNVDCVGTEDNIWSCPHIDEHNENCGHSRDAGVECL